MRVSGLVALTICVVGASPPLQAQDATVDRYAGYYQLTPGIILTVSRPEDQSQGDRIRVRSTGGVEFVVFAQGEAKFVSRAAPVEVDFLPLAPGPAMELVLNQNGRERHAMRIDAAAALAIEKRVHSANVNHNMAVFNPNTPMGGNSLAAP